jgi:putative membrane-bound dehydrogenase-like protein
MKRLLLAAFCLGLSLMPLAADEPKKQASAQEGPFPVPEMTPRRTDVKPFEYVDVGKKIPNYTPSRTWGVQGEPLSKMQRPLPAEESIKHLVVPKGFHLELFVSEEQLGGGKPICMNWDERGRLWVAMTYDYPNQLQPPDQGHDRIVCCEDSDGDGKADKVTVFADKLSIPTSLFFARGGVIVFDAGRTIFLKDSDGDGKADVREVLFGTWNMRDTHGTASNMQYGLDNWIWGMQGYNRSRITLKNGEKTEFFNQGFFRFKSDGSKFEFIRSTDNNTWGLGISEEGIIFGSTANRNPSVYMPIPNRYYERVRGWTTSLQLHTIADSYLFKPITDKVRQVDQHGGYTAGAGHSLYTARRYPREYWNRTAFVAEPTGHLVGTFVLRRDGSHFRSNNPFNLVASDDEWTAPTMAEVGPDGNVWVIDWYNYIVQHNPTPIGFKTGKGAAYETDLRDKKYARIYRIVHDGPGAREGKERFTLAGATPDKLVATLRNDNLFWRRHAQRLLVERGKRDVVPALVAMARDRGVDAIGLNVGVIHALWTLHGLSARNGWSKEANAVAVAALKHPSAGVRRNAVQVLPWGARSVAAILDAGLTKDPDAQVRLMSLLALADQPSTPAAGEAIVAALCDPSNAGDRWIPDAATSAAANNSETFLKALSARKAPSSKVFAVAAIVAEHYARGAPVDSAATVVAGLVDADPQIIAAVVRGLAKGWPAKKPPKLDERTEQNLETLLTRLPPERRGELIKLTIAWGSKKFEQRAAEVSRSLLARVKDESLPAAQRVAAALELAGYRSSDVATAEALLEQITPRTPPEVAVGFLQALEVSEAADTGKLILERLPALTPATRSAGLGILLTRPEWTRALLAGAEQDKVRLVDLSLDQQRALTEHPDPRIRFQARRILSRGGALPNPDRQKVLEDLLGVTREKGDPVAGKAVFVNQCSKCHVHGTEGHRIGPDLTGMAVHPKDHLLTDILDPSRSVEANFRAYTVTTQAGRIFTGLLASESKTTIELFDAEGKKQTILRQDIDELVATNKSLMPDGFEKLLSRKDLANLLEFLTQRGKYLALPLDRAATILSTRGMLTGEESRSERLLLGDYKPRTFAGVPFTLVDPRDDRVPNVIMLYSPRGKQPPRMPRSVSLTCNLPARAIHLLGGISGWGYPDSEKGTVSMTVRLHYADGTTEDHALKNGEQLAGYLRRVDVPGSKFAFDLDGRQVRYLAIEPKRKDRIERIDFVKGPDDTAPIVLAVTVEPVESEEKAPEKSVPGDGSPLKEAFKDKFLIGTALDLRNFQGQPPMHIAIATRHFSAFTPENSMKPMSVQPTEGHFRFDNADRLVELAQKSGAAPIGHCLVWHVQTPRWFFQGPDDKPAGRELALVRMRKHIATVVGHYKGRVKQWDVVNEAISDAPRQQLRPSSWLKAIGEDYIAEAFRAAHEADPRAILIYNDYGIELRDKRRKALKLLKSLLEQKVPVHAVGIQCHWRLDYPDLAEVEESIKQFGALGLKVMITELDIGVLPTKYWGADISRTETPKGEQRAKMNPYTQGLPDSVAQKLAERYRQAFAMFLRHKDIIGRVTFWGVDDGHSWLNHFPVRGRTDYPLLFDRQGKPKAAFFAVMKAVQETEKSTSASR